MNATYYILNCCVNSNIIVWLPIVSGTLSDDLIGSSVNEVYRTVGIAGTCLKVLAVNVTTYSLPATHTINPSVTGLVDTLQGCSASGCQSCSALTAIPQPSNTPQATLTPQPTPTPVSSPIITSKCCDGTTAYFSSFDSFGAGNTVVYNNECYQFITTGGPGGPLVSKFIGSGSGDCNDCESVYPCITPTPTVSVTATNTPAATKTPTPTPSTSAPPVDPNACCYTCDEYVFDALGGPGTISYTDCNGKDLVIQIADGTQLFLCVCSGSNIIVSGGIEFTPTGEPCIKSCSTGSCGGYAVTNIGGEPTTVTYKDCFAPSNNILTAEVLPGETIQICSCEYPSGIALNITETGPCGCESLPTTPTQTPSTTQTRTPQPTPSHTPTTTPDVTPTITNTPSHTPTTTADVTQTPTVTQTQTPTTTAEVTQTPTVTQTQTPTTTAEVTQTPTVTQTHTPSATADVTQTPTVTQTQTPSRTPGGTPQPTPTQTPSTTADVTQTPTVTQTQTPSDTPGETPTQTPTTTADVTQTPTVTLTQTPSGTPGGTPQPTPTQTPSTTADVTQTPTVTQTYTPSSTPDGTPSVTPTQTPSTTADVTQTPTVTLTQTPSDTPAGTPDVTQTQTPSTTPDVTQTPTVTQTQTPSDTPDVTQTQTPSTTPDVTPTQTVTLSPTRTSTHTPTPTKTVTVTPTITQTPTPTITPTSSAVQPFDGSVTFRMFDEEFVCNTVRKLVSCDNSQTYYVTSSISYDGTPITTGMTFVGNIVSALGSEKICLYYDSDVDGSSTAYITEVFSIETDCDTCDVPVSPTPTMTPTMTNTPTLTTTPTPSPSGGVIYAYVKCGRSNVMITQTVMVEGTTTTNSFSYEGECWTLYGVFATPWSPPSIYTPVNVNYNYFGNSVVIYNDCVTCQNPPVTPSLTPTLPLPSPSNTPSLPCNYYEITNYDRSNNGSYSYVDCNGINQTGIILADSDIFVCSTSTPSVSNNVSVTNTNTLCN